MKKFLLKVRILLTNISRVIMSFLFINLNFSFLNKVFAETNEENLLEVFQLSKFSNDVTCYSVATPLSSKIGNALLSSKKVFFLIVPIAIVIEIIIVIVENKRKKLKKKKKENENIVEVSDKNEHELKEESDNAKKD
jgi:glucan phosphoethanolaminetransferase (alkaline phosphatase superfamily)